jgi:signal transduction histidine kinase
MTGIRGRLTANFLIVILISVLILEVLLIYTVKENYYDSLRGNLINQIKISGDMYSKYYSDTSLENNILYNVDAFWNQSNAMVEIVDKEGNIIMNSVGASLSQGDATQDINAALNGRIGEWIGRLGGEKVMAVAYPLESEGEIVGALRFIASTEKIDEDIKSTVGIFISIGLFVILAVGILGIFLTNTIIVPLKEVTLTAERMAEGDFQVKSTKKRNDEIGKLSDTINYMADEIQRKEKLKNDFISSVSHELRTPLTSIMGWAITLQNEQFQNKDTLEDGLGIIAKESERLTGMVEELLDFSKFVSGRIRLEYEDANLEELLEDIRKQMALRAIEKDIDFTVNYKDKLPVLAADGNRLKQLFINILDNAFNFTDPGGSVEFQADVTDKELVFRITDTGCGISPEELPLVKGKFYKGKSSASKNGIGLSICEEIVSLMNGRLDIQSQVGKGTTVLVNLPKGREANA